MKRWMSYQSERIRLPAKGVAKDATLNGTVLGNAMHAVRTQCEVLDVGKYSNPSFGPFSQVFGSVPGFFWLPKHLGCGIFELSTISP